MKQLRNKLEIIIISVLVILILVIRNVVKDRILKNHIATEGQIIYYTVGGVDYNKILKYRYFVNEVEYFRTISPSIDLIQCEDSINICSKKRFRVIYSPDNPAKSLIDLTIEIQNNAYPISPSTFQNFE